jgi:hypothetical protein
VLNGFINLIEIKRLRDEIRFEKTGNVIYKEEIAEMTAV